MHSLDKTLRHPLDVDGTSAKKETTYAAGSPAPGSSTDLDGFDTHRRDSRLDRIGYDGEHALGTTLTMVLAGVGTVTLVASRPAVA